MAERQFTTLSNGQTVEIVGEKYVSRDGKLEAVIRYLDGFYEGFGEFHISGFTGRVETKQTLDPSVWTAECEGQQDFI